ncbi:hypothetical protein EAH74_19775 [Pseudomonas mandelii]|uniref:Uncharacterized protein n=1 Tax=Pseudomonas mandelii TaxID=75612 RepID=A0A502I5P6_9PSED|nr:hypothetical protein EAH74_19775 [Pseudomonas mandelii]
MAAGQSTSMSTDPPPSRASSLPHWVCSDHKKPTGIKKRRHPGSAFINPLFFFLSFHHIPQRFQLRFAE